MERVKLILKKLFCIHWGWSVVLTVCGGAGLVWVFGFGKEAAPISYGCYVLAFYALVTACVSLVPAVIRWTNRRRAVRNGKTDVEKETDFRRGLQRSLAVNLLYAGGNLFLGAVSGSVWLQSMGLYYLMLAVIRLVLGRYAAKIAVQQDPIARRCLGWSGFQACGVLLLALHLTTTGPVFQIIRNGGNGTRGEIAVIAAAAYTFYRVIAAIIGVVQYRRNPGPIWGAARNLNLTEAWMSIFFLQASMLEFLGGSEAFCRLMNSLTGGAVCVMVVFGAVGMIAHGKKKKRILP